MLSTREMLAYTFGERNPQPGVGTFFDSPQLGGGQEQMDGVFM